MSRIQREHIYLTLIILIIFCIFEYGIQKIFGFTVYPDEFGYWSSAAKTAGYDWHEVASLGSYYSFGYSVLLIPLLWLFRDGVAAYRAAVAVNMALMCFGVLLLRNIICRLFPEMDKIKRVFISGIAVLYPSWVFYMQVTLAEALLTFLFLGLTFLFICFIQKPGILTAAVLAVSLVYSYSVHMRTVGVVIACLAALALWGVVNPAMRKQMLILFGVILAAGLVVAVIKRNVILSVFSKADAQTLAANDYGSQMWKVRDILTSDGMLVFLKEILAKFFYLGMATYGFFYWAMIWCVQKAAGLFKKIVQKQSVFFDVQSWTALFLLLAVIGEILICSIYMHGSTHIDCLIYGRYNEFLVPVLIVTGITAMLKSRRIFRTNLLLGALSGLMIFPILSVIRQENMEGIRGYFVAGISCLIDEANFEPLDFLLKAWIFGFILMLLTAGIFLIIKKWKNMEWLLAIILIIEVFLGIQVSAHYIYKVNQIEYKDLIIAEKILESNDGSETVTYLDEGSAPFVDFQQMQLGEIPIHVIRGEVSEHMDGLGDYLIVRSDSGQKEVLEQIYNEKIVAKLHVLYFNRKE